MVARLSTTAQYALLALLNLRLERDEPPVSCAAICNRCKLPARYVLQVMRLLVQAGLADSIRGTNGGYYLIRPLNEITLLDITGAVETPPRHERPDVLASGTAQSMVEQAMANIAGYARDQLRRITVADIERAYAQGLRKAATAGSSGG